MTSTGATDRRRGRPPRSADDLRQRRLDVSRHAVALFRADGFAATTGAAIAEAAGLSERSLWRLFGTKEECVAPLLSAVIEGFCDVVRAWPPERTLAEHLRAAYGSGQEPPSPDLDDALAVVRLSREEPGLRAVWLLLQERAEPTLATAIAARRGDPVDSPETQVRVATMSGVLRVVTDDVAWRAVDGVTTATSRRHGEQLAAMLDAVV